MTGSLRVLVVEDDDDHRELIVRRLATGGFTVRSCATAEDALRVSEVDVVLLDRRLPGMDGMDALRAMRSPDGPAIVIMTAMGSEQLAVEAMREGAVDYLTKDQAYLANLPTVVERAWLAHDLRRRAEEMQRLMVLTASATNRDQLTSAIVRGARSLLRAAGCALYVRGDSGLALEARDGALPVEDRTFFLDENIVSFVDAEEASVASVLMPVAAADGEAIGLLAIFAGRPIVGEELRLAQAFASFAGIGLANLRRLELEQKLVHELQQMLDMRREFAASISHELRTPLTCIKGFANVLESRWEAFSDVERRQFIAKIGWHAGELEDLVVRLLDFAAVESGHLSFALVAVDLARSLQTSVDALAPALGARTIAVDVGDVHVLVDPILLHRIVSNLLSNSIKYSDSGITIGVRVDGGQARIEVIDEGVGLTAEEATRAFEPFWRSSHATKSALRGAGIGLALVREYVRLMGGDVGVESQPGRGSRFWFTVKLADCPQSSAECAVAHNPTVESQMRGCVVSPSRKSRGSDRAGHSP